MSPPLKLLSILLVRVQPSAASRSCCCCCGWLCCSCLAAQLLLRCSKGLREQQQTMAPSPAGEKKHTQEQGQKQVQVVALLQFVPVLLLLLLLWSLPPYPAPACCQEPLQLSQVLLAHTCVRLAAVAARTSVPAAAAVAAVLPWRRCSGDRLALRLPTCCPICRSLCPYTAQQQPAARLRQ